VKIILKHTMASLNKKTNTAEQTFRIVGPPLPEQASRQQTMVGRFVGTKLPVDLTASNAMKLHDAWTMKDERTNPSGPVDNYVLEKNALSDDPSERAAFRGAPEGSLTGPRHSNYFVLIKEKGDFMAIPVDQWVTFRYAAGSRKFNAQSLEEAEAAMKYRRLEAEKQDVISLAKLGEMDTDKDVKKKGGKKEEGKDEEPDSDDEWKDVKAEKLKRIAERPASLHDTEDGTVRRQGTALDFKDEYKPDGAEDWEHEIAADDDDLDMGDDDDVADENGMGVNGGYGNQSGMINSPSVSGDDLDGDMSDGGMGDSSLRQKLKRVLKKRIGDDSADEQDGDSDGDDDDVDALDAMASGDFEPRKAVDAPRSEEDAGKKRKNLENPPPQEKKQKKAPVEAAGVPSEEEIKSLLISKKRMLLSEIASEFKKRLKNANDRKLFTSRVKSVAMLDPSEKDKSKRYLILKS
jgi:hypothetical protein